MNIKCTLTITRSNVDRENGQVKILVRDDNARCQFLELTVNDSDLIDALRSVAEVPCKGTVKGLDKVGKTMVTKPLSFPLPDNSNYSNQKAIAAELAVKNTPDGWVADTYFGSQNSFTRDKNGNTIAHTTIRKWE